MSEGRSARVVRRLGGIALTTGAVIGALCLIITVVCVATSTRPLVVLSGSMSPEIPTGALAFATSTPADEIEVGDVVSVVATDDRGDEQRVTHRVVSIDHSGAQRALVLKGDANRTEDPQPYLVDHVDRVLFDVPVLGRAVAAIGSPLGIFALGMGACGLLLFAFRPGSGRPRAGGRRKATMAALPVAAAVLVTSTTTGTGAWFNDVNATVTTANIAAHTVLRPAAPTCGVSGLGRTITFTVANPDSRYDIVGRVYRGTTLVGGDRAFTVAANGSTATLSMDVSALFGLLGIGTQNFTIRVYSTVPNAWESQGFREHAFSISGLTLLLASYSCGSAGAGQPDPGSPVQAASCAVHNTSTGAVDPGSTCTLTAATCTPNGNGQQTHVYLNFASTFNDNASNNWGNNLQVRFSGNLQTLGCADSAMNWSTAGTTASSGNVTWTPTGFPCSNLPNVSGTVARFQTSSNTYAGQLYYNRTPVAQSALSCTK